MAERLLLVSGYYSDVNGCSNQIIYATLRLLHFNPSLEVGLKNNIESEYSNTHFLEHLHRIDQIPKPNAVENIKTRHLVEAFFINSRNFLICISLPYRPNPKIVKFRANRNRATLSLYVYLGYCLVDGIFSDWHIFIKKISEPQGATVNILECFKRPTTRT